MTYSGGKRVPEEFTGTLPQKRVCLRPAVDDAAKDEKTMDHQSEGSMLTRVSNLQSNDSRRDGHTIS